MKTITPTELRGNLYQILDDILDTGIPIEIDKDGKKLMITPLEPTNKLQSLKQRENIIKGDPTDLVDITWEKEINLDLP